MIHLTTVPDPPSDLGDGTPQAYFQNQPLEPVGGGMIVHNGQRFWIQGTPQAVSSTQVVYGLQDSVVPQNPLSRNQLFLPVGFYAQWYDDGSTQTPPNQPFPTLWAPQVTTTTAGTSSTTTTYFPVALTHATFHGVKGADLNRVYLNRNLQIAGGYQGDPFPVPNEDTVPYLWQNYQYHKLSDFFPALSNYTTFQVKGLDDNGVITAIATPTGGSQEIVQLFDVKITQANYPVPSPLDNSTDSGQPTVSKVINAHGDNGIALITGAPAMPQLTAKFNGFEGSNLTVDWRLAVTSERTERGVRDNIFLPVQAGEGGTGGPGIVNNVPINTAWDISGDYLMSPQSFFGGNVTVYYRIKKADGTYLTPSEQTLTTFKIRGMNPLDVTAKSFITTGLAGGANSDVFQFAWSLVQEESRQGNHVYNQFNAAGSTAKLPNFGGPDGWGIGQLDTPLGVSANTEEVYNWEINLNKLYLEIDEKITNQQHFFTAVATAYPTDIEAQNPPKTTLYGTNISALAAGAITLYNGAGGCPFTTLNGVTYHNPWTFDHTQPSRQKWVYHPNVQDYLHKVLQEYQGATYSE